MLSARPDQTAGEPPLGCLLCVVSENIDRAKRLVKWRASVVAAESPHCLAVIPRRFHESRKRAQNPCLLHVFVLDSSQHSCTIS